MQGSSKLFHEPELNLPISTASLNRDLQHLFGKEHKKDGPSWKRAVNLKALWKSLRMQEPDF